MARWQPSTSTVTSPSVNLSPPCSCLMPNTARNVHHALHQELEQEQAVAWTASAPTTPVHKNQQQQQQQQQQQGRSSPRGQPYPAPDDIGARNDAAFHAYLWAMVQKHPRECRRDW